MFLITYGPRAATTHIGSYNSLSGIILAARESGALIEEWDARWGVWREI